MEKRRKTKIGRVVSNKMDKTVVVAVNSTRQHPLYQKTIKKTVMYKAHYQNNDCGLGDFVRIIETRPLSREKRWWVAEIINKAEAIEVKPEEIQIESDELEAEAEAVEETAEEAVAEPNESQTGEKDE